MANITPQVMTEAGLELTLSNAAGGGDTIIGAGVPRGRLFLYVGNTDSSDHTVTITPATAAADVPGFGRLTRGNIGPITVTQAEFRLIPLVEDAFFNTSGNAAVTYSSATGMKIAAVVLPAPKQ